MPFDARFHHRRSIRLPGYDYSEPGMYALALVTQDRVPLLSTIVAREVELSPYGRIVQEVWAGLPARYPHVELDAFVLMPDHLHGLLFITEPAPATFRTPPALGQMVAYFKYESTRRINAARGGGVERVWQRNYYERIVRDERELCTLRQYIELNPAVWPKEPGL